MISNKLIWFRHQLNKKLVGSLLPLKWFGPTPPKASALTRATQPMHLQIVSHCWQYSHMLNFQLSSILMHPPKNFTLTYTLYHAAEDTNLKQLINRVGKLDTPNVTWDWAEVTKPDLFRRAIGRNRTALTTKADWLWFSDCDLIFHEHCLESLATTLTNKQERMVFPSEEFITDLLEQTHPMLNQSNDADVYVDTSLFSRNTINKAKGAFQIVHGDVARTCGYCKDMPMYQAPMQHWSKTFEDTIFRQLIDSEGTPVNIPGLYRIRHQEKGRYVKDKPLSKVRQGIRIATDNSGKKT